MCIVLFSLLFLIGDLQILVICNTLLGSAMLYKLMLMSASTTAMCSIDGLTLRLKPSSRISCFRVASETVILHVHNVDPATLVTKYHSIYWYLA